MSTVYYNDIDPYCCAVLRKNIERGNLPQGDVDERDIRTVTTDELAGYQHIHLFAGIGGFPLGIRRKLNRFRLITGGFPCQDISQVGNRAGITGTRSGLWRTMHGLIHRLRPDYVLVENVSALLIPIKRDGYIEPAPMSRVLGDLSQSGYDAVWRMFSSAQFGACHRRERVYIVAYPNGLGLQGRQNTRSSIASRAQRAQQLARLLSSGIRLDVSQSAIRRVDDELSRRLDKVASTNRDANRIKALGNSIDPRIPDYIASCIVAYEQAKEDAA